ncbi:regulatory protein, luxR family [Thalassobacillus cyri]|uniref:Regulatory protein, luxR family n=1 Tax=Thalassobacillus cyri TaxID=571932 RepID=A0A1H4EFA2_9BACI|nr:LuxR C-terminal-related transcriptional regulator [Thalassobacillus cyri]SEA83735.1 regulatory protein, luxR family [Thalassobacillus cyri]
MRENTELLEELQQVYAERLGLTIMITDANGERISSIAGDNDLCSYLLEHGDLWCQIQEAAVWEWNITRPTFYDILPGIYFLVIPVNNDQGKPYLVWAGAMIEEGTQRLTQQQLHQQYGSEPSWEDMLTKNPVIKPENKSWWIHRSDKLSQLIHMCLQDYTTYSEGEGQAQLLRKSIFSEEFSIDGLLDYFLTHKKEFDYLGLAEVEGEEQYKITRALGEDSRHLQGVRFALGEGFLGRAAITKEADYWEDIANNPRSYFFHRHHFYPKTITCFPIHRYDGSLAVLFGGSLSNGQVSSRAMETGEFLSAMLEASLYTHDLQKENNHQLNRLSSLVEICKLMAATPDLKRILYILVDISMNLAEGPFSTVILRNNAGDKVQLVSRGDVPSKIKEYVREVVQRHYGTTTMRNVTEAQLYNTSWGTTVMECPLMHRQELLGVLCVGVGDSSDQQLKEHQTFLHTLAIIGAVSLQLAKQEQEAENISSQADALFQAISQFDEEAFGKVESSGALAGDFARHMGLPAPLVNDIVTSCQLSYYSAEFLKEMLADSKVPNLVAEGKALLEGNKRIVWDEASIGSQIFALVAAFTDDRNGWESYFSGVEESIIKEFRDFLKESQTSEQEFTLNDEAGPGPDLVVADHAVKEQMNLSPREQEVLELVIKGLNNREIAEKLYISGHTVKNHVTKIFQKLEVPDRAHAISKVYQLKYQNNNS